MSRLFALILAGGSGTRLWPISRNALPKQFLALCGREQTLLQLTALRLSRVVDGADRICAIASPRWSDVISSQLSDVGLAQARFIAEPESRNTAPAIALGISEMLRGGASRDDVVLVCPSDHIMADEEAFVYAARTAFEEARRGAIITFGIKPTSPQTGFGYIKTTSAARGERSIPVESFVEKPDLERARRYVASGDYYWNGGCFCFRIQEMIDAYERYFPDGAHIFAPDARQSEAAFLASPKISIDYAIMERAANIECVPLDAGWSDVGSWDAVWESSPRDERGNALSGSAMLLGTSGSIVSATSNDRLVVVIDMEDVVVMDTPNAVLVAPRSSSQKLADAVKMIREERFL